MQKNPETSGLPKLSASASWKQSVECPVTVKTALTWVSLPDASRTVMTTAWLPSGRAVPATGDCVTESEPLAVQLSLATTVAAKFGTAAEQFWPAAPLSAAV